MNYKKIYQSFIENRKLCESALLSSGEYKERHHILPRALGGTDEAANIICLTPEDHYFAHLLLAKIYGGKMWCALVAMANMDHGAQRGDAIKKRVQFGHVRRLVAQYFRDNHSGIDSASADRTIFQLLHHDGSKAKGNRFELEEQTGLSRGLISGLVIGVKMTSKGWSSPIHNPNGLSRSELISASKRKADIFALYHYDERIFEGTRADFAKETGKRLYLGGGIEVCYGWYTSKHLAETHYQRMSEKCFLNSQIRGDISGKNNPNADPTLYTFVNEKTGESVKRTRVQMRNEFGLIKHQVTGVIRGTQISANGWTLPGAVRKRAPKGAKYTFVHESGEVFTGLRSELERRAGKSKGFALALIRGSIRHGWRCPQAHKVRPNSKDSQLEGTAN